MIRVEASWVRSSDSAELGPFRLTLGRGERVLISGPSGAGKSTLLSLLSGGLARHGRGRVVGEVRIDERDPATMPPAERPSCLGVVPQEPGDALVAGTVADEVAFGPRCAGLTELERRVGEALERAGCRVDRGRDPRELSTGERQRVVIAGALAAGAPVLLLDEPLAFLDPAGAEALLRELAALSEVGVTVVVAEHRVRTVLPWCTRHVALRDGVVVADGAPGASPPEPDALPLAPPAEEVVLRVDGVDEPRAPGLRDLSVELRAKERVAVLGANGVGKSTLLRALAAGSPDRIEVPADPDLTLFCGTVREELAYGPTERRLPGAMEHVIRVARALRIEHLLDRAPHASSRGERLRIAVAAALCTRPAVLLLDEPTAGQDEAAVERLFAGLRELVPDAAVIFATHDPGVARRHAHRTIVLGER
ncbi:MAG: ATP-binding cassette domain-containing protein [Alphaproteobacteria bacterium]|nr:ATP-binding cassette domain-containing protein [Alphaproteobacteria bacterium]